MILTFIKGAVMETVYLFVNMTPYILFGMIAAGMLSVYISKSMVSRLIGKNTFSSIIKASLLGVPLPLCSCGVIPAAQYLKKNGASRASAVSFLISTPQTGIDSIIASYGLMGPFFAVMRPVSAFITGIWGGFLSYFLDRKPEKPEIMIQPGEHSDTHDKTGRFKKFTDFAFVEFLDDISVQFTIGIIAAGIISFAIPDNFFESSVISGGFSGMALMLLLGIPLYVCSTSSIPIALAMIAKGITPGTAYVFLIAGPAVNAASFPVLLKVLGKKQTLIYIFSIISGSFASGFFIDYISGYLDITSGLLLSGTAGEENTVFAQIIYISSAVFFLLLLIASFMRKSGLIRGFSLFPGKAECEESVSCCNNNCNS